MPYRKRSVCRVVYFRYCNSLRSQQHNRIHNGRQIRVQLRDHGPNQRSLWRPPHGRGMASTPNFPTLRADGWRGLSQTHHSPSAERSPGPKLSAGFEYQDLSKPDMKSQPILPSPGRLNVAGDRSPMKPTRAGERGLEADTLSRVSLPTPSPAYDQQSQYTSSATPAPSVSSVGPSTSIVGTAPPYAVPSVGFFAPPWVPAYPPPYTYPVPFMPAPAYAAIPPSHLQQSRHESTTEVAAPTDPQQMWQSQNEAQRVRRNEIVPAMSSDAFSSQ